MLDEKVEPEEFEAYRAEILEEQSEIERQIQAHLDASRWRKSGNFCKSSIRTRFWMM